MGAICARIYCGRQGLDAIQSYQRHLGSDRSSGSPSYSILWYCTGMQEGAHRYLGSTRQVKNSRVNWKRKSSGVSRTNANHGARTERFGSSATIQQLRE